MTDRNRNYAHAKKGTLYLREIDSDHSVVHRRYSKEKKNCSNFLTLKIH